nr:Uncharacterised protein [Klebsiella pneumoniae]
MSDGIVIIGSGFAARQLVKIFVSRMRKSR